MCHRATILSIACKRGTNEECRRPATKTGGLCIDTLARSGARAVSPSVVTTTVLLRAVHRALAVGSEKLSEAKLPG